MPGAKNANGILYSYWRSSSAWRVRVALNLLRVKYDMRYINLLKKEQFAAEFLKVNPLGTVPVYIPAKTKEPIFQSTAIIQHMDRNGLLTSKPRSLEIAQTIACEIQPLVNLRVLERIESLGHSRAGWASEVIQSGLKIVEQLVDKKTRFCVSNKPSIADAFLIPQLYGARRFNVKVPARLEEICQEALKVEAFQNAHPHAQEDCPAEELEKDKANSVY